MEVRTVPISQIKPAPYNPRKDLTPKDPEYDKLKRSIEHFGLVDPLVWNADTGNLIGGHQRLRILKDMGTEEVEVSVVHLSEKDEKALNIALNKIEGEWDMPKLKNLLAELEGLDDMDIELTGFDFEEIENIVNVFADEFKRPSFDSLIDELDDKKDNDAPAEKNKNWFYVEYYQDQATYEAMVALLGEHMATPHEIDAEFFAEMVKYYITNVADVEGAPA